jgi:hypothetical protein
MTPFTFECPGFAAGDGYGKFNVRAIRTSATGILLTEAKEIEGVYRLTHEASGMAITTGAYASSHDAFGLLTLADVLGKAGDWTRDAAAIAADEDFGAVIKPLVMNADIEWTSFGTTPEHRAASIAALSPGSN